MLRRTLVSLSASLFIASPSFAILFDFEGEAATFVPPGARTGALTSLAITEDGLMMTITRPAAAAPGQFDIVRNILGQGGKPAGWSLNSLDPFFQETIATPFVIDFSSPIQSFAVEAGDYGADSPDILLIEAFAGPGATGALLDSESVPFPGAFPAFITGAVSSATPIGSIRMIGGTAAFPHSLFYDNIVVQRVPEPSVLALLGIALAALSAVRRRSERA